MLDKLDFISAAILDTQTTIRAIDVKVAALLVGILAPLPNINRIFSHLNHFGVQSPRWLFCGVVVLFLLSWLLALLALVRGYAGTGKVRQSIEAQGCECWRFGDGVFDSHDQTQSGVPVWIGEEKAAFTTLAHLRVWGKGPKRFVFSPSRGLREGRKTQCGFSQLSLAIGYGNVPPGGIE